MKFDAVLMAGGRSSRFGRDKALVEIEGVPLWRRQLSLLRALEPERLFVSGVRPGWGVEMVEDAEPRCGPFSGFVAALRRCEETHLLMLAVDLPKMSVGYLQALLDRGRGVVPMRSGLFEPLVAVYPRAMLPAAERWLRAGDESFQVFLRDAARNAVIDAVKVDLEDAHLFTNMNRPESQPA